MSKRSKSTGVERLGPRFQVEKLQERFERATRASKPVKEEWLELVLRGEDVVIANRGFSYDQLLNRVSELETSPAPTSPHYFVCALNGSGLDAFIVLLKWIGAQLNVETRILQHDERGKIKEITSLISIDMVKLCGSSSELDRSVLTADLSGRRKKKRQAVPTTPIDVPRIPQTFLRDNRQLVDARWQITSNAGDCSWLVLAYHHDAEDGSPLPLPVLYKTGSGGLGAFMQSQEKSELLNALPRKGWLYWIYARIDFGGDLLPGRVSRKRMSVHRNADDGFRNKFVLFSLIQGESTYSAAMFARFHTHANTLMHMFRFHVYIEARNLRRLRHDKVIDSLAKVTSGNPEIVNIVIRSREDPISFLPFMCQVDKTSTIEDLREVIAERIPFKFNLYAANHLGNEDVLKLMMSKDANVQTMLTEEQLQSYKLLEDATATLAALELASGDELFLERHVTSEFSGTLLQTGTLPPNAKVLDIFQEIRSNNFKKIGADKLRLQSSRVAAESAQQAKEERSKAAKRRLFQVCKDLGAYLVDAADIVVTNKKPIGMGRTAQVFEGLLLSRIDRLATYEGLHLESAEAVTGSQHEAREANANEVEEEVIHVAAESDGELEEKEEEPGDGGGFNGAGPSTSVVAVKVAIKKFTCKFVTAQVAGTFENEISLLCKLKHPSLVRLLGVYINSESVNASMMQLMIIYELMKRGSLQSLRRSKNWNESIPFEQRLKMAISVAEGIEFLHDNGVMHRDIKSDNLLLDDSFNLKLGDFGVSTVLQRSATANAPTGTIGYCAPEVMKEDAEYDLSCDIFSFGVVLWELLNALPNPFYVSPVESYITNMQNNNHIASLQFPESTPQEYIQLTKDCLRYNKDERPDASDLVTRLKALRTT